MVPCKDGSIDMINMFPVNSGSLSDFNILTFGVSHIIIVYEPSHKRLYGTIIFSFPEKNA